MSVNQELSGLRVEVKTLKKLTEGLETDKFELEKILEKKNEELKNLHADKVGLLESVRELTQRLENLQKSNALSFGLEPAQMALLILQAIPLAVDVNRGPIEEKKADSLVNLIAQRQIPVARRIVREVLDQIAKD